MTILPPPLQPLPDGFRLPYVKELVYLTFKGRQRTIHVDSAPLGERPSSIPPEDWGTESTTGFFGKLLTKLRAR